MSEKVYNKLRDYLIECNLSKFSKFDLFAIVRHVFLMSDTENVIISKLLILQFLYQRLRPVMRKYVHVHCRFLF
jgi:hypothetical protein